MGCAGKRELGIFARRIMVAELPPVWCMKWTTSGNWCDRPARTIYLDEGLTTEHRWASREVVLHEIAHGLATEDDVHGESFYREYIVLLTRYMRAGKE